MLYGKIIVIKRSGADGAQFPLTTSNCLFGRSNDCDIRIQLPNVSREHCRITVADNGEVFLTNLSAVNPITVNSKYIETSLRLNHGDVFTIIDRSFRFEALSGKSPIRSPGKSLKNNVFTPVKGSPSKTFGTPKNIDMNETCPLRPLSPKKTPRTLTPQPTKGVKSNTPRHNSTPPDMKHAMKILTPKSKPPYPSDDIVSSGKKKKSRVQSPSPVRNTSLKNHVSRADTKTPKSKSPGRTPSKVKETEDTKLKTPNVKTPIRMPIPAKSPGRSQPMTKSPGVKTPIKSSVRTPVAKTHEKTMTPSPNMKLQVAKTPAKSPGRSVSPAIKRTVKSPARSGRSPSQGTTPAKLKAGKTPAKSPGRSPSAKTPAKSSGRSPAAKAPAKSPGWSTSLDSTSSAKSPTVETPARSPAVTPAKSPGQSTSPASKSSAMSPAVKTPAKSPGQSMSPASNTPAKSPAGKTPAKSPGRSESPASKSTAIIPARSPGQSPSPAGKSPAKSPTVRTPARSPGRSPSPAVKSSAKSPAVTPARSGRSSSPSAKSPFTVSTAKSVKASKSTPLAAKKAIPKSERKSLPAERKTPSPKQMRRKTLPAGSPYVKGPQVFKTGLSEIKGSPAGLEMMKGGDKRKSTDDIAPSAKKKRISFGPQLSPEMFDKKLPPMTPVRKGTTPRRLSEPIQVDSPKSLLKRKSIAVFRKESTITEESPRKESPSKKPTPGKKSPAHKDSPKSRNTSMSKSPKTTPTGRKSPVNKSPSRKSDKKLSKNFSGSSPKSVDISYTGIEELMITPQVTTSTPKPGKSSGKKAKRSSTGTLMGVKNLLKTPKENPTDISFTGLSAIMKTPETIDHAQETKSSTTKKAKISPKSIKKTPPRRTPTPRKTPKSLKKTPKAVKQSPQSSLKNAIAIRAIHGKSRTPKLPSNLWSDVVKKGIVEKGVARRVSPEKAIKVLTKKARTPKSNKKKMPPKTPRTKAANLAPTTGHVASPLTIVIRKKIAGTPGPLPRKGRKSMGMKKSKKQTQVRLSGVADMFQTPSPGNPSITSDTPHSLYSDLPETPTGPGEMIVSPLSATKRKSVHTPKMSGLKTLFSQSKHTSEVKGGGIKQLLATPKQLKPPASPTGVKEMFQTPKSTGRSTVKKSVNKKSPAKSTVKKISAKSSTKKTPVEIASPVTSRGKKRAAPTSPDVHEVVVEAPTKRARRGAVKKTLEKTQVTASALQRREKTLDKEPMEEVATATPISARSRGRRGLKVSPKVARSSKAALRSFPEKKVSQKSPVAKKGKGKAPSPLKKEETPKKRTTRGGKVITPIKVAESSRNEDVPAASILNDAESKRKEKSAKKATPAKRTTRGKRASPLKKSPVKRVGRAIAKKIVSPEKTKTASPSKPVVRGKRKRNESSSEAEPPSKKTVEVESPPAKSPIVKRTRGRGRQALKTPVKSSKMPNKTKGRREKKAETPKKSPAEKITHGIATKGVKISESTPETLPKVRGKTRKLAASMKKAASPIKKNLPEESASPKKSPLKRTRRGQRVASPKIKTPVKVKSIKKNTGQNQAVAIILTPVKTRRGRKASPLKTVNADETSKAELKSTTIQPASPAKIATPVASKKGGKRKASSPVKTVTPQVNKKSETVEQPVKRGKAKTVHKNTGTTSTGKTASPSPVKRTTRSNPKPKTPAKGQNATKKGTPKVLKASLKTVKAKTASPKQKSPVKRVTRARR